LTQTIIFFIPTSIYTRNYSIVNQTSI